MNIKEKNPIIINAPIAIIKKNNIISLTIILFFANSKLENICSPQEYLIANICNIKNNIH